MSDKPAPQAFCDISPALADYTDKVLFGDMWKRPGLSPRGSSPCSPASRARMPRQATAAAVARFHATSADFVLAGVIFITPAGDEGRSGPQLLLRILARLVSMQWSNRR